MKPKSENANGLPQRVHSSVRTRNLGASGLKTGILLMAVANELSGPELRRVVVCSVVMLKRISA